MKKNIDGGNRKYILVQLPERILTTFLLSVAKEDEKRIAKCIEI